MSLKIARDFGDSLISLYENTKETDSAIEKSFTYDNEYYPSNLFAIDDVGNHANLGDSGNINHADYSELVSFIKSLPYSNNNLFKSDNEIYFYKIVELIKLSSDSDKTNLKKDSLELLKLGDILIKIVESKHDRKGTKDSNKFGTERLVGFIESHIVELAIKQKLTEITTKVFNFIDDRYNILYAENGSDQPDLKVEDYDYNYIYTFEIKPERSDTNVHNPDFIIKYKVVDSNSKVQFGVIPYMIGNYDNEGLDKIVQTKQSNLQFEVDLKPFRKELGLETHLTEAKLRQIYIELLENGNDIYQLYSKYISILKKAKSKKEVVDKLEKAFIKSMNKTVNNKSLEELEEIIKKLQSFIKIETDVQDSLKIEESNNFKTEIKKKENCNMLNLLEVYDLMEGTDPQAAKTFGAAAKEGKIDEDSFEAAYRDELVNLKLGYDLMDRGLLKDKSSYGKIKKAAGENPDSWAVKALLKLGVLQFKDNAKSVRKEREEAEAAEKAKKEKELKELSEKYLPIVETKVKEIIEKVVYPAYDSINAAFEETQNKAEKIKDLSRGLTDLTWVKNGNPTNKLTKEDCVQYKLNLYRYYSSDEIGLRLDLLNFFDKKSSSNLNQLLNDIQSKNEKLSDHLIYNGLRFSLSEIDEGQAYEILTICFELLAEVIQKDTTRIDMVNKAYENLVYKIEGSKKAKAAVNADKPVDPDFIAHLLADIRKGKEKAEDDRKFGSDSTDGSDGAAYHMALFRTAEEIAPYLFDCHWRSYIGTKQVAEGKPSDSDNQLKDALMDTIFSYQPNLNIEILKD